jgi:hypothetical protein
MGERGNKKLVEKKLESRPGSNVQKVKSLFRLVTSLYEQS